MGLIFSGKDEGTGLYTMSAADYHADPAPEPSLPSSIAGIIWHRSPLHGWTCHPRLNPEWEPQESDAAMSLGTLAHAMVLEGRDITMVVDAADWRTKAAREARENAISSGMIPLLAHQVRHVHDMVERAKEAFGVARRGDTGHAERVIIGKLDGTWCRARPDWLSDDMTHVIDYKTVSRSARPEAFRRHAEGMGYDIQAALYCAMVEYITGREPAWTWLVQETDPPYACSIIQPSAAMLHVGRRKLDIVLKQWRSGLQTGHWPAYTLTPQTIDPTVWDLARVEEEELEDLT